MNKLITDFKQQYILRVQRPLEVVMAEDTVVFKLTVPDDKALSVEVPLPFMEDNVAFVRRAGVQRALFNYFIEETQQMLGYTAVIREILLGDPQKILPPEIYPNKAIALQAIKYGFINDNIAIVVNRIQKAINYVVSQYPLHETIMASWAVNKRLVIIDNNVDFKNLTPQEQHEYQVAKNEKYYHLGWSSLGLSDSTLAGKNYLLTEDLRKYTPFGIKHHNPQRNLYSTLMMRGDEKPLVTSKSAKELELLGVSRTGWNLFTAFVDIPDVWEDQLMVDISHRDKFIEYDKRYRCYSLPLVRKDQSLYKGDVLSITDGVQITYDIEADEAWVESIHEELDTYLVTVKYRRYLTDGTKLTNTAANKGVIRMRDLGYAVHPVTGEKRKIDVIVSAKAVLKRKNYTQLLEALCTTLSGDKPVVVEDDKEVTEEGIKEALCTAGLPEDGTWECETYVGKLKAVCGTVFWGVTHDAHDNVWNKEDVEKVDSNGIRKSGLKFSVIEFSALRKRFGSNNPLEQEILSHAIGQSIIKEELQIIKSQLAEVKAPVINYTDITPLVATNAALLFTEEELADTIADVDLNSGEAFCLRLPIKYQTLLDANGEVLSSGFPTIDDVTEINGRRVAHKHTTDVIYVPSKALRGTFLDNSGKFGLTDLTAKLNTIITLAHRYQKDQEQSVSLSLLYKAVGSYFSHVKKKLSTKRGSLAVLGMSVRYPHSIRGVATLSNTLPANTVEIGTELAKDLGVNHGDIVLVERFPCLGFMSIRPQQVYVTDDPQCRYTIRVSGNSLGSLSLDFDGDTIYLAKFTTPEAKKALREEWENPDATCYSHITQYNSKMGEPHFKELTLNDYNITSFSLSKAKLVDVVGKLVGVKAYTGLVVALAYNLFRISERAAMEEEAIITKCLSALEDIYV